jgi:hypothetical protein
VHEGWCHHHVQAIIMSIDQYAGAATAIGSFDWACEMGPSLMAVWQLAFYRSSPK